MKPLPTRLTQAKPKLSVETVTQYPFFMDNEDEYNVVFVDGIPTSMHDLTQTPKVGFRTLLNKLIVGNR
jgi:hypothetical protein